MANIKSAKLRIKKDAKKSSRNKYWSNKLKNAIKSFDSKEKNQKSVNSLKSVIDKATLKGAISKNKASRIKSKLTKK